MITREDVLRNAAEACMKELYSLALPKVQWEDFVKQNKEYKEGTPKPYEFYYLPKEIFEEVVNSYINAYSIKSEFEDHLELLMDYFKNPIRDKYIEGTNGSPGYRGYEYFAPLKEIIGQENMSKVIKYIQRARNFFKFDRDLNNFKITIYLGASPSSNKESVIKNWEKYKGINISIDDSYWEDYLDY